MGVAGIISIGCEDVQSGRIRERLYVLYSSDVLGALTESQWTDLPAAKRYEKLVDYESGAARTGRGRQWALAIPGLAASQRGSAQVRSRG